MEEGKYNKESIMQDCDQTVTKENIGYESSLEQKGDGEIVETCVQKKWSPLIIAFIVFGILVIKSFAGEILTDDVVTAITSSILAYVLIKNFPNLVDTGKTFISNVVNPSIDQISLLLELNNKQKIGYRDCIENLNSFELYFNSIRNALLERIYNADKQAALLLDKGIMTAYKGIALYIFFIAVWQIVPIYTEMKIQYYWGYASSTALFVFMEFLAAWNLKQYRNYVETSTYLIKIKSILDRYALTYLAVKETSENTVDTRLTDLLREDIKWPDTYLTKTPDVSFAKECMETATQLIRAARSEAQSGGKKEVKGDSLFQREK